MDIEKASREIDDFIARRAEQSAAEREREALWAESARGRREKRRRENRKAWYTFEMHMHNLHTALAEEHYAKAQRLIDDGREEIAGRTAISASSKPEGLRW